jgi:hypothetical protein
MDNIGTIVLATGALGTAAFGIVEGLKRWRWLGEAGFGTILVVLDAIYETLKTAYGPDVEQLLRAQYRGEQEQLARVLRQGVRIGLTPENAERVARALGMVDPERLKAAAAAAQEGKELPPEMRNILGRFELAVDARIDAALTLAHDQYVSAVKIAASGVALAIAIAVGIQLQRILLGVLVGIAAVPLAPIAKDVATALKSAGEALRARS